MVSHHVFSQLVLLALVWLFVILRLAWPKRPVTTPAVPALPEPLTPKRPRSNEPKPFEGLPTSPIAPCVTKTPRLPKRLRRCRPIPWHRPTGVPVRSTRPGTFVRTVIVTIGAGSGCGISAPTVIPVAAPGASSTVPRVRVIFWRPTGRFSVLSQILLRRS